MSALERIVNGAVAVTLAALLVFMVVKLVGARRRVYVRAVDGQCLVIIGQSRPVVIQQPSWRCE